MKKTMQCFTRVICTLLLFSLALFPVTRCRVISSSSTFLLLIDKGSGAGIKVGMKGIVKSVFSDASGEYEVNIGLAMVKRVTTTTADVAVTNLGVGFKIADAKVVEFDPSFQFPETEDQGAGVGREEQPANHTVAVPAKAKNRRGYWEAVFFNQTACVFVPAGEFKLGSPPQQGNTDEHPAHKVWIDGFWLGKTEVTFEQFDHFCRETNRSLVKDEGWGRGNRPVINVSWEDAQLYCQWLTRNSGFVCRLPTEAEWEKAVHNIFPWGSAEPDPSRANVKGTADGYSFSAPVGSFPLGASPYGILDLAGNVWEWIADWYSANYYQFSVYRNPRGPAIGKSRVVRGGSWTNVPGLVRGANRSYEDPSRRLNVIGFRVALDDKSNLLGI